MNKIIQQSFASRIKVDGEAQGVVEAIVSVFDVVDSYKERVRPGAYAESLKRKLPKCVWHHNWEEPIAKVEAAYELNSGDDRLPDELKEFGGLFVRLKFFEEIEDSWQAYLKIKNGLIDEFSIGYRLNKYEADQETGIWDLTEIDLTEVSPVLKGACPMTQPTSIKQFLSEVPAGLSLDQHADAIASAAEQFAGRCEKSLTDRESKGTATAEFYRRLKEAGEKILSLVPDARDAEGAEQAPPKSAMEWERIRHAMSVRDIKGA